MVVQKKLIIFWGYILYHTICEEFYQGGGGSSMPKHYGTGETDYMFDINFVQNDFTVAPEAIYGMKNFDFGPGDFAINMEHLILRDYMFRPYFTKSGSAESIGGQKLALLAFGSNDVIRVNYFQKETPSTSFTVTFDTPLNCVEQPVGGIVFNGQTFTSTKREAKMEVLEVTTHGMKVSTMPDNYVPDWVSFQTYAGCSEKIEVYTGHAENVVGPDYTVVNLDINRLDLVQNGGIFTTGLMGFKQTNPSEYFHVYEYNNYRDNALRGLDPEKPCKFKSDSPSGFDYITAGYLGMIWCEENCLYCGYQSENCTKCQFKYYLDSADDTTCKLCSIPISNCLDCNSSTYCSICYEGYYLSGGKCKQCQEQCAKCTSIYSCQQQCSNSSCKYCNTSDQCTECYDGEYLSDDGACLSCDNTTCATCTFSSQNCDIYCNENCKECNETGSCISCNFGSVLEDGECNQLNCGLQEFVNSSNECQECDNTVCGTCTGFDANCDVFCNNDCKECDYSGDCTLCEDGKYLEDGECKQCDNTQCATCSSLNTCILDCGETCKECDVNGDCILCEDGEFANSSNQCEQCDNTVCGTCTGYDTNCDIFCNNDCKQCDYSGDCTLCEDGKYLEDGECKYCDNTQCATCSALNNCILDCGATCKECDVNGGCTLCEDGEFINGFNECEQCDNTVCGTCTGPSSNCVISCNDDCKQCDITGQCISCVDGLYLENGECKSCDNTQCGTCKITDSNCLVNCHESCQTCDVNGFCLSCLANQYNDGEICIDCNYQCGTCSNFSNNCLTCSDSNRDLNNNCDCSIGYYQEDQNLICSWCDSKCESCSNESSNCLICAQNREQNPPICSLSCQPGFYSDNGECKKCKYDCECIEYEYCNKCLKQDIMLRSPKDCSCKTGYYEDENQICQHCDYKCQSCEGSAENCTSCSKNIQNLNSECGCTDGYYENQDFQICIKCPSQCKTCDENGVCLECILPFMQVPFCQNRFNGFFEVSPNPEDQIQYTQCDHQCLKCQTTPENCLECIIGKNREKEPSCLCQVGYHDNYQAQSDCTECPPLCQSCSSQNLCSKCVMNSEIDLESSICVCSQGFKEIQVNGNYQCLKCYMYKDDCLVKCPKNTITDEQNQICLMYKNEKTGIISLVYILSTILFIFLILGCLLTSKSSQYFKIQVVGEEKEVLFPEEQQNKTTQFKQNDNVA